MYELLQTLCLAFFALALLVLFPFEGKVIRIASLGFGVAGLFVVSFLGLMTQYYFLLFVAPVAAFALVYLVAKKRTSTLLWSVLAVGAGFYLAYRAFPQMKDHLTLSYRAGQSIKNLVNPDVAHKLATLVAYLKILSANLVPAVALVAVAVMAIVARIQKAGAQTRRERTALEVPVFVMTVAVFAVTFVVVSVSAPYQTARYIGAFFPIYALAFVGFTRVALPSRSSLVILCASAILVFAHGVQPANICEFHEDYPIDKNSFYMSDSKPVILMATPEGGSWKNMLPYLNFSKGKRVYVAYNSIKAPIAVSLGDIAKSSGEKEVYAIVDDYFAMQPPFEKIGYYGFYFVYRIRVE